MISFLHQLAFNFHSLMSLPPVPIEHMPEPMLAFWQLALPIASGLMGMMKHNKAVENENKDRQLVSNMQKYSYATGQSADPSSIRRAGSMFSDVGQGALAGAMTAQSLGAGGAPPAGGGGLGNATNIASTFGGAANAGLGNKIASGLDLTGSAVGAGDTSYGGIGNQSPWGDILNKKMQGGKAPTFFG